MNTQTDSIDIIAMALSHLSLEEKDAILGRHLESIVRRAINDGKTDATYTVNSALEKLQRFMSPVEAQKFSREITEATGHDARHYTIRRGPLPVRTFDEIMTAAKMREDQEKGNRNRRDY